MEISNIVIAGEGDLANRIKERLSKSGLKATISKSDFAKAEIVIEALSADVAAKRLLLSMADKHTTESTVLATTSSFNISELAATTKDPRKFVGLNFIFNPLQDALVVQIVKCVETSEQTIDICKKLAEKIGGTAIVVEDSPGLVLDRIMAMVINEAAIMYAAKLATIEDIDRVTKLCLNWPMGPFEFADTIGIDNVIATLDSLSKGGYQFTPCRYLKGMVAMGRLGKKSGKGFYTYN
jgi:3-hydroxybutyryl-CoA dehydrogenase